MSQKNQNSFPKVFDLKSAATPSRLADYFWAGVIFFGFMGALGFVLWQTVQSPLEDQMVTQLLSQTLSFMFFGIFLIGFLAVMLLDAAYDFFAEKAETMESGQ